MAKEDEGLSPRDEKILLAIIKNAKTHFEEEHIPDDELARLIEGMYVQTWLPIDTMPEPGIMPVVIWWCDNWVMVYNEAGEWVTDSNEYPFRDEEDKPTYWCMLPPPPLEAIKRVIAEAYPDLC